MVTIKCPNCEKVVEIENVTGIYKCYACNENFNYTARSFPAVSVPNTQRVEHETKIVFYNGQHEMQNGISYMSKQGWEVVSSEVVKGDYGCFQVTCLALIFLPLALLGKSRDKYKVMYKRIV